MGDGNTETDEESRCNKHAHIESDRLEDNTENHNDTADYDTPTSTEKIGDVWNGWESNDGTNGHDCVEETARGLVGTLEC